MNTTNTNEPIERKEKQKATLFVADLEMRDYFAAKVLRLYSDDTLELMEENARKAYAQADAMLKARNL